MRASAIEFRLRMLINAAIIFLGFWAPWIGWLRVGHRMPLIGWLGLELSRMGIVSFGTATPLLIAIAALFALLGCFFRVSGTAFLGPGTVTSTKMIAGKVMADGPYRFVRNPLYIGIWCMVAALAFLMPATGALLAIVLISIFLLRLTLGEEAFLSSQLGEPYRAYLRAVPRFIPRFRGAPAAAGEKPRWLRAVSAELTPVGILAGIVAYSRDYNLALAVRIILIFFGASLVVRAFMPGVLEPSPRRYVP
jgi:protein-S-isoprenylcysteine O-methyltransferase Ste14